MTSAARRLAFGVFALAAIVWIFFAPFSVVGNANLALSYALVAISLVVLTGWVGQISLAQATFVGIGSYVTGIVVRNWSMPFPLTLPVAAGIAAAAAVLLGIVALRVRGLYLAVATLIFAWMGQEYLFNQPWLAGPGGTSSAEIPNLGVEGSVPYFDFSNRTTMYFIFLAATALAIFGAANVRDSKTGRAWFAVKGSEVAAASLGIDVTRYKLLAFGVSGFLAGASGSLMFTHKQVATSVAFTPTVSLFFLSIAVVGGLTSLGGAVASGALFALLEELFFRFEVLAGSLQIVSAVLLAIVLLFFPAGLAGLPRRFAGPVGALWGAAHRRMRSVLELWERDAESTEVAPIEDAQVGNTNPDQALDAAHGGDNSRTRHFGMALARVGRTAGRLRDPARRETAIPPDALGESLAGANRRAQAAQVRRLQETLRAPAEGLVYVPGTATKVSLPARKRRARVLSADHITVRFGGLAAVDDYSLDVREHEIVGLIGPNGAGKTTLFNAISGLNEPTDGTISVFGEDVTPLPVNERARRGVGRTFQVIQLFPQLSVFENLLVATHVRNPTSFFAHLSASPRSVAYERAARRRVHEVTVLLGLEEVAQRPAASLPFGTLRLVEVARALVTGAPFVMLDEPASGLDNAETDRFMDLLLWIRQSLGVTLLLIEHDVRVVTNICDHIYVIDRGHRIASGTATEIQRNPDVIAAYLGRAAPEQGRAVDGLASPPRKVARNGARSAARRGGKHPVAAATRARSATRVD